MQCPEQQQGGSRRLRCLAIRWAVEHCITPPCGGLCVLLPPPPTTTTTATAEQEAEEDDDESDDEESANRKRLRKRTMTVVGCGNDSHRMCRECLTKQVFEAALRERRVACCPMCRVGLHSDVARHFLSAGKLRDYKEIELQVLFSQYFVCPTPNCSFRIDVPAECHDVPHRVDCVQCGQSSCSSCRSQPFHHGIACAEFPAVRATFFGWLQSLTRAALARGASECGAARVCVARDAAAGRGAQGP